MRQCPSCGNAYADDARFCPMDATLLPAADHALPFGLSPQGQPGEAIPEPIQSTLQTDVSQRVVVASRFIIEPEFVDTPTGRLHRWGGPRRSCGRLPEDPDAVARSSRGRR